MKWKQVRTILCAAHVHVNKLNLVQWYYQYIHEQVLPLNNFSLTIILLLSLHAISYYLFYLCFRLLFVICVLLYVPVLSL